MTSEFFLLLWLEMCTILDRGFQWPLDFPISRKVLSKCNLKILLLQCQWPCKAQKETFHFTVVEGVDKTPLDILLDSYSLGLFDIFWIFVDQIVALKHFLAWFWGLSLLWKAEKLKSWKLFNFLIFFTNFGTAWP